MYAAKIARTFENRSPRIGQSVLKFVESCAQILRAVLKFGIETVDLGKGIRSEAE